MRYIVIFLAAVLLAVTAYFTLHKPEDIVQPSFTVSAVLIAVGPGINDSTGVITSFERPFQISPDTDLYLSLEIVPADSLWRSMIDQPIKQPMRLWGSVIHADRLLPVVKIDSVKFD